LERLTWRTATVLDTVEETPGARTIVLDVPGWSGHAAGQHVDVRLTADDGYQAERSYSIASAPGAGRVALTIERIDDGEVSPYLAGELRTGDAFEIRGPIGGHFTWRPEDGGPLLLVGGGSGLVPLMSMLREREARDSDAEARLLVSARAIEDVLYLGELGSLSGVAVRLTLTRSQPPGWDGYARRVDAAMLGEVGPAADRRPRVFVCGPTPFVETAADLLVGLGHPPGSIHAERFGPTGG
jgi:ferredoxin-NADP reductase